MLGDLLDRASRLIVDCHRLLGQASPSIRASLALTLRAMNSYYTNKIEGQHTLPADIQRAIERQFDADRELQRRQRLAIAHMEAEVELERSLLALEARELFSPDRVRAIHAALYGRLPESDRLTEEGEPIVAGAWRTRRVVTGRHIAPSAEDVSEFIDAWSARYRDLRGNERLIVGAACAHHRLTWVHPFIDGNGRTARLHTHLLLYRLGLSDGLWSPMRGLARSHETYYARLNNADLPRRNDYDGRGPLSTEELVAFAQYFLDVCLDQVEFMRGMLALDRFRDRLEEMLQFLQARPWGIGSEKSVVRPEALPAIHYVALTGAVERSTFLAMTGLPQRTARRVLASLLDYGLLRSGSRLGPVAFAIPLKSLRWLFPRLWPEADDTLGA
ncbi:MAG: Fic family protein [Betaproteobacteria bacterium]|nr:Fic family protein [Betaproteobacteria bacterium]